MKTSKKTLPETSLDEIIKNGSAAKETVSRRGRKKDPVQKVQKSFHLSPDIIEAIDTNHLGNRSAFVEMILREYFKKNRML